MRFIFTLLILLIINEAFTQDGVNAIGLRAGDGGGITYKYMEDGRYGFEGIISYRERGFQLTGMYELYKSIRTDRIRNFYFFSGFGAHTGYIRTLEQFYGQGNGQYVLLEDKRTHVVGGLDGVVGFEYFFYSVPLSISLDYKPYVEFFGKKFFRIDMWNFGLSFRYTF